MPRRLGILLAALTAVCSWGDAAWAQDATGAPGGVPQASDPDGEYWDAVHLALREYAAGNWAEARVAFGKAHQLRPSARTYRGLGLTAYELRDYVEAVRALRLALEDTRAPLTPGQRDEITALVAQAERYVGQVILEPAPGDLVVRVNGRLRGVGEGGVLRLNLGKHQLTLERPGQPTVVRAVELRGGDVITLRTDLAPSGEPPASSPTPAAVPTAAEPRTAPAEPSAVPGGAPPAPAVERTSAPTRTWTWVALGGGAVLAGVAGVLWMEGTDRLDGVASACEPEGCSRAERDRRVDAADLGFYETSTSVALGLSAAALLGGVVLFFVEGADERPVAGDELSLQLSPLGVRVGGTL